MDENKWKPYKLNELGEVKRGKSRHRPRNDLSLMGGAYPLIQTGDVKAASFYINKYSETYNEKGLAQSKLWPVGTLCITIAANIAETAILNIESCFPDSIIGFIPYKNKADVRFVKYQFDILKLHIQNISQGTTQDNLSLEKLLRFEFSTPTLPTQQKVASILSAYDDLIEVNNKRIQLLEETARELYKEWFVRMRFPGWETAKFKKGIPEGWVLKTLSEFGNIYTGKTPSTKVKEYYGGDIPFIKTPDMHSNIFIQNTEECLSIKGSNHQRRSALPRHSICVSCIGTGGVVAITTAKVSHTNQQINSIIPDNKFDLQFLYFAVRNLKETIELFGYTGATMTNLSKGKFEKLKVLYPTDKLALNFHELVQPFFSQIENLQAQNTQLAEIRDRLLPRLISGKLQVSADNNKKTQTKKKQKATARV